MNCRWCNEELEGDGLLISTNMICPGCGADQCATMRVSQLDGRSIAFYHNPDNSLFIEFEQPGGKTSRFTLSETVLKHLGTLKYFDSPPKGKK